MVTELGVFLGQAVSVAAAFGVLVMVLSIFFRRFSKRSAPGSGLVSGAGAALFDEGRYYDVLLSSGHRLTRLRFEGLVQPDAEAGWSLRQLAVMRRADGGKVIVRIDSVRVFEEVSAAARAG